MAEALERGNERITVEDLARVYERKLAFQRALCEQPNPFVGKVDAALLNRVTSADAGRNAGISLSARAGRKQKKTSQAADYLGGR